MRDRSVSFAVTLSALFLGCNGDPAEPEREEEPAEHACERASDPSDGTPLRAGSDTASAPTLELSEDPYLVSLSATATPGAFEGYLSVEGPVDAILFASIENAVSGLTFAGGEDELPAGSPSELCPDTVPEHFDLELERTGSYHLHLTSALQDLWLLYLSAEGHAH